MSKKDSSSGAPDGKKTRRLFGIARSASTGRYVASSTAARHPSTSVQKGATEALAPAKRRRSSTTGRYITRVTAPQVRAARFRVARDKTAGRRTPERVEKIAEVSLPEDRSKA